MIEAHGLFTPDIGTGYVFIYPLFCFFTEKQIRMLMMGFIIVLMTMISLALVKKRKIAIAILLWGSSISIHPWFLISTMEYLPVVIIALIGCFFVIHNKVNYGLWAMLGTTCAFYDMITIGTITFCLPYLLYTLLNSKNIKVKPFLLSGIVWSFVRSFFSKYCGKNNYTTRC